MNPSDSRDPELTQPLGSETVVGHVSAPNVGPGGFSGQWRVGDVIMDTYEVKRIHEAGAMGRVYRVYHREWNRHVAVKSPRPTYFHSEKQKQDFVRECLAWIGLGVHPHIVTCHYVRLIDGIPRVFAEYVESGTLKDWIRSGRLYEGGPAEALRRILDFSIQFAWGLEFAHGRDLVHQDVKPANVLVTTGRVIKVSDFGLASARAAAGEGAASRPDNSSEMSYGGMTPAYCSPEQAAKQPVTKRTDIWSWGVSVLEMFVGRVRWDAGPSADSALESFLSGKHDQTPLAGMPDSLVVLLRCCLKRNPAERIADFGQVYTRLRGTYREFCGREYDRPIPKPIEGLADVLNNQALSLLELGLVDEAEVHFDAALRADAHHPESVYNRGLHFWRAGRTTDSDILERLDEAGTIHAASWRIPYLKGMVHLERADALSATRCFAEAQSRGCGGNAQKGLAYARELAQRTPSLRSFHAHRDEVHEVRLTDDGRLALATYDDKTVRVWDTRSERCLSVLPGHPEFAQSQDHRYSVVHGALNGDGRFALTACDHTIRFWDLSSGRCRWTVEDSEQIFDLSLSTDGRLAVWEGMPVITGQSKPGEGYRTCCVLETDSQRLLFRKTRDMMDLGAAFSPDGNQLLSGFATAENNVWKGGIILWDVTTGKELTRLIGHTSWVTSVAFGHDGLTALSGSQDNTVRLWDLNTGHLLREFRGNHARVSPGSYGASGQLIFLGDKVQRWDRVSGRCLRTFDEITWNPSSSARALAADGIVLISGEKDGTLHICDVGRTPWPEYRSDYSFVVNMTTEEALSAEELYERLLSEAAEKADIGDIADGLAAARRARQLPGRFKDPRAVAVWSIVGKTCRRKSLLDAWQYKVLKGHDGTVSAVALSANGKNLFSAGHDKTIRIWDTATGECHRVLQGHEAPVNGLTLNSYETLALSGSGALAGEKKENALRLWDLKSGNCIRTFGRQPVRIGAVAVGLNGTIAISGNGSFLDEMSQGLVFQRSGGELVHNTSSRDKLVSLRVWDLRTGACVKTLRGHRFAIEAVAISADGRLALSGSDDSTVRLWDLFTGRCLQVIDAGVWVRSVVVDINNKAAYFPNSDSSVCYWDLGRGEIVRTFDGHELLVSCIALSICGRTMLTGSDDKKLRVWEVPTGAKLMTLEGHSEGVQCVALSGNAQLAASGSNDGTIRLWQLDWEQEFPGWSDWDEGARPYLASFLRLHGCKLAGFIRRRIGRALLEVKPTWSEPDFQQLLETLSFAGYGWLKPEGVRRELTRMCSASSVSD